MMAGLHTLSDAQLLRFARKVCLWGDAEAAIAWPEYVVARVMNIGEFDDTQLLIHLVGEDALRKVLLHARPGAFAPSSWVYWHIRLGLADIEHIPPMPGCAKNKSVTVLKVNSALPG